MCSEAEVRIGPGRRMIHVSVSTAAVRLTQSDTPKAEDSRGGKDTFCHLSQCLLSVSAFKCGDFTL